jgi:hypothetical protein
LYKNLYNLKKFAADDVALEVSSIVMKGYGGFPRLPSIIFILGKMNMTSYEFTNLFNIPPIPFFLLWFPSFTVFDLCTEIENCYSVLFIQSFYL